MMDKLEKFIIENREDFNIHEPDPAIWDKIKKSTQKEKKKVIAWRSVLWRAAIIVVIFTAGFTASKFFTNEDIRANRQIEKIPQLVEAEAYYSSMVNDKLGQIERHYSDHPDLQDDILKDFEELDNMYDDLKKDLFDNIATQEIVEAMIQNYRLKLEILEDILNELSEQEKNSKHEKTEIEL